MAASIMDVGMTGFADLAFPDSDFAAAGAGFLSSARAGGSGGGEGVDAGCVCWTDGSTGAEGVRISAAVCAGVTTGAAMGTSPL